MRRIVFVNRYFFPDFSATSQMLSDLAFHLAEAGHRVAVLTSRQRYDDPDARLPEREQVNGVEIRRVATTNFGRAALAGRAFDYLSFYRSVYSAILAETSPGDVLVAKTDPPLVCVPAWRAARRRGLRLINWIADLYPEVAVKLGVPLLGGPLGKPFFRMRDATLHAAVANVVLGERMGAIICSRGVPAAHVHLIHNWCDDQEITPIAPGDNPLRREWGLAGRFVVGYSGNLGRGHEFETVLDAAERLRDMPNLVFLFIGGGHLYGDLRKRVSERKLDPLFRFLPYQDRSALKYSLAVPDIHWISQQPALEGLIVPSKFYGIAAAGRAIACITAADGDLARHVAAHRCGIVVEPGDGARLAAELRRVAADPEALTEMGRRARAMLDANFTRHKAFAMWRDLLASLD